MGGERIDEMDLWTYLKSFARWWWIVLVVPAATFAVAVFLLFPSAPWQASWNTFIGFNDNPARANSYVYVDFIVLDDIEHLIQSDVAGDLLYLRLPEDITTEYSREEIGEMFSSYRHARFVEIFVTGDDANVVDVVAQTMEEILPEVVNQYLVPPDLPNTPGVVETMDELQPAEQLTNERWLNVAAVTGASIALALCLVGIAEWLRLSYRAKYGER